MCSVGGMRCLPSCSLSALVEGGNVRSQVWELYLSANVLHKSKFRAPVVNWQTRFFVVVVVVHL